MTAPPSEADLALLRAYFATAWRVDLPVGPRTLRLGVPFRDAPSLPCGIITAYNPRSELVPEPRNRAANRALLSALEAAGARIYAALAQPADTGDERWAEPGFLVAGLDLEEVIRLAGERDQNAIVWLERDSVPHLVVSRPGFCAGHPGDRLHTP